MQVRGRIFKQNKNDDLYCVMIPAIGMWTQGTSIEDGKEMAEDWMETAYPELKFHIEFLNKSRGEFILNSLDKKLTSIILKHAREESGLSLDQAAKKLGFSNKNSVYAYESGKREPTLSKFQELLSAYGVKLECEFAKVA